MFKNDIANGKIMPTISQVIKAMQAADSEGTARDTRLLLSYETRALDSDSRLKNLIRLRRVGVTCFSWEISPLDEKDSERVKLVEYRCRRAIQNILKFHTDTPAFGAIALELAWDALGSENRPRLLKRYKPVEIMRNEIADNIEIMPDGDKLKKFIINSNVRQSWILDTDESIEAGGIIRGLLIKQILKNDMLQEWANFNKLVKGLITATVTDASSQEDIAAAEQALTSLYQRKFAIVDELTKFDFKEVVSQIGSTSFKDLIGSIDLDAAFAVVGQAGSSDTQNTGSFAKLAVLSKISADITYDDIVRCEDMINDQLLTFDFQMNKGDKLATEAPWKFKFIIPEEVDLEARVAAISGLITSGVPLKSQEIYNTIGFSKPDNVPDIFESGQSANNPFGSGNPPVQLNTGGV